MIAEAKPLPAGPASEAGCQRRTRPTENATPAASGFRNHRKVAFCFAVAKLSPAMSKTLITSVSGVRGIVGCGLTAELVTRYAAAFGTLLREGGSGPVVMGRDSRATGPMLATAAITGLLSADCEIVDCGLVPTPTVQLAVEYHSAAGGLVVTASHNPIEWNALKFIGADGVFLDADRGRKLATLVEGLEVSPSEQSGAAIVRTDDGAVARHIAKVLAIDWLDVAAIKERRAKVALDCVRGAGGVIMPLLLEQLGCEVVTIHAKPDGRFPREPEPIPGNLLELGVLVRETRADIGFAVDPDVDRLAIVDENGVAIGEDYTLAFAVEVVLSRDRGAVVANLSTSRVVDDAAARFATEVQRTPVGEANVVRAMRECGAVIGGEGNGGVILPALHLGRDGPVAAALALDLMARLNMKVSELVERSPKYTIIKDKVPKGAPLGTVYELLRNSFGKARTDSQDGLHLSWDDSWLHVRSSGTEPIIRLIAEATSRDAAEDLCEKAREIVERCAE